MTILRTSSAAIALLAMCRLADAQVLTYTDCVVEDAPSLVAAITRGMDSMAGETRPQIYLDQWLWNGEFEVTHRIIVAYPDYAAFSAFQESAASNPIAPSVGQSIEFATDCRTDGLSVLRGAWGNQEAQGVYWQVYGVSTSDGAGYAEALDELAEAQADAAVGPIVLFENRAGISTDTHLVAIGAPTFAALNEYLDQLFASDEFADFLDAVGDDRELTWRAQAMRAQVWGN